MFTYIANNLFSQSCTSLNIKHACFIDENNVIINICTTTHCE